jgi:hypothetical protein
VLDFRELWEQGLTFEDFVAVAGERYKGLWEGVYRTARLPEWAMAPGAEERRFLVIAEDWCGDASNIVPVVARWVAAIPGFSMRIIRRDQHPEVMDRYLTGTARSIPIVIVLDREFRELGHWGPRPNELQAWVMAHKDTMPKDERYKEVRRWYAKDHGETILREVIGVMQAERAA